MNIEQRVRTLESRLFVDADELPEGVFCYPIDGRKDAPPPEPVKGLDCTPGVRQRRLGQSDRGFGFS